MHAYHGRTYVGDESLGLIRVEKESVITNYATKTDTCPHLRVSLPMSTDLAGNALFYVEFSFVTISS